MRIAVLGSTGMAGHMIAQYLEEKGYEIFRVSRSEQNGIYSRAIDITNFTELTNFLDEVSPKAVINCIGLLQHECEQRPDLAVLINAYLPHFLEQYFAKRETKVIHLSTDCVFSGNQGNYIENALPDGRTMYDRSKALGEIINCKDLTFRMSIIGPDTNPKGTGLFNWFLHQNGDIQGYSKTIWNGITTLELARAIDAVLHTSLSGLYQLVHPQPIDKYSLLCLLYQAFPKEGLYIHKVDKPVIDKSLVNTRTDFDFNVNSYPQQILKIKEWVQMHPALYPQYQ